jgi:hypothetical protein
MASGKPVVTGVLLERSGEDPVLVESFSLKTTSTEIVDQLDDLGRQMSSKLSGLRVIRTVVRIADFQRVAARTAGSRHRLLVEGALSYACKVHVSDVRILNGKEIGKSMGTSKEAADAAGSELDAGRREAASAALAALEGV